MTRSKSNRHPRESSHRPSLEPKHTQLQSQLAQRCPHWRPWPHSPPSLTCPGRSTDRRLFCRRADPGHAATIPDRPQPAATGRGTASSQGCAAGTDPPPSCSPSPAVPCDSQPLELRGLSSGLSRAELRKRRSHQGLTPGSGAERGWDARSRLRATRQLPPCRGEKQVLGGQRESLRPPQLPPELWTNPRGLAVRSSPSGFRRVAADNEARGCSSQVKVPPSLWRPPGTEGLKSSCPWRAAGQEPGDPSIASETRRSPPLPLLFL